MRLALAMLALFLLSCSSGTPAEIVVVVDSDLRVPDELDEIEIVVTSSRSAPVTAVASLEGRDAQPLPVTLTVFSADDLETVVAVTVVGNRESSQVVRVETRTSFVSGDTRMLRVVLARRCLAASCGDGNTCDEKGCRSVLVAPSALAPFEGTPPHLVGDSCEPREELCNAFDDDCDGASDEGIDLLTSAEHCGSCGHACDGACENGYCPGEQPSSIAAGGAHTCVLREAGTLSCFGLNLDGQLGAGVFDERPFGVVPVLEGSTSVSLGAAHSCAVSEEALYCFGDGASGELASGSTDDLAAPTRAPDLGVVAQVAAGVFHTCLRLGSGEVRCAGANDRGQLGNGTNTAATTPVPVTGVPGAMDVAAGFQHSCAVVSGDVFCWGGNDDGQLGDGTQTSSSTPRQVVGLSGPAQRVATGFAHTCVLLEAGTVECFGDGRSGQLGPSMTASSAPVAVPGIEGAEEIVTGSATSHSCALLGSGVVTCWGANGAAQLGQPAAASLGPTMLSSDAAAVAVGGFATQGRGHTCVLSREGALSCVGAGTLGQLGPGRLTDATMLTPVRGFP